MLSLTSSWKTIDIQSIQEIKLCGLLHLARVISKCCCVNTINPISESGHLHNYVLGGLNLDIPPSTLTSILQVKLIINSLQLRVLPRELGSGGQKRIIKDLNTKQSIHGYCCGQTTVDHPGQNTIALFLNSTFPGSITHQVPLLSEHGSSLNI